ncbi:hypothetical protein OsJ_04645 [Oryza sativa Japonica Group]|uniref:Uncharacterized protein n=1 Tax=Oryza sativa subsp. japonica TaxID=39947 RepID=A3A173_ORYSJ|nr:hypothetical protein OsJ_04645 [Oryza sativa Japonica Group]
MEVESAARRMWGYLRAVFFMVRKGVISKRRLLLGMQLAMRLKRRNRAVARSVASLLSHHHGGGGGGALRRRREYEFSCSNSPDVVHGAKAVDYWGHLTAQYCRLFVGQQHDQYYLEVVQ